VWNAPRVQLGNIYDILTQFIKLVVGLGLPFATSKNHDALNVAVLPPFLMKVNMASFVNNVIWIRWQDISKQPAIEALVNEIDGYTTNISHVLHSSNHYWLAYVRFLKIDKFHCTSLDSRQ
jgi:hypothetical protein